MAGKGSKSRTANISQYTENYDSIDWQRKPTLNKKRMDELIREVKKAIPRATEDAN